jgi:hypothetical protein
MILNYIIRIYFILSLFIFILIPITLISQWTKPLRISEKLPGYPQKPFITITQYGKLLIIWPQKLDTNKMHTCIYYREYYNGQLSDIDSMSSSETAASSPFVSSDQDGTIHALWGERFGNPFPAFVQYPTDYYHSKKENGKWTKPVSIFHTDIQNIPTRAVIKGDRQGRIHLVINQSTGIYKKYENSEWSAPIEIPNWFIYPDFIVKNNTIDFVFISPTGLTTDVNSVYYMSSDNLGGFWSKAIVVQKSGLYPAYDSKIHLDNSNTLHILWFRSPSTGTLNSCLYYTCSNEGSIWSLPLPITDIDESIISETPDILSDKLNNLHLFYGSYLPQLTDYNIYYKKRINKEWGEPELLINNAHYPVARIDSSGYIHLVYASVRTYTDEPMYLYYTRTTDPITKTQDITRTIREFKLDQNYPNPFNSSTIIKYYLFRECKVNLKIFNSLGQVVEILKDGIENAGGHTIIWDPTEKRNIPSGIYYYRIQAESFVDIKKLIYLK